MISIMYGCLKTARELTCSMSCLALCLFQDDCVLVSLRCTFRPPPPFLVLSAYSMFVAQCACLLLCSCSRFDAPRVPQPLSVANGCACPHASSQRFLVDVAILVQLWHRRLTSTLARMCCLPTSFSISRARCAHDDGGDFW